MSSNILPRTFALGIVFLYFVFLNAAFAIVRSPLALAILALGVAAGIHVLSVADTKAIREAGHEPILESHSRSWASFFWLVAAPIAYFFRSRTPDWKYSLSIFAMWLANIAALVLISRVQNG